MPKKVGAYHFPSMMSWWPPFNFTAEIDFLLHAAQVLVWWHQMDGEGLLGELWVWGCSLCSEVISFLLWTLSRFRGWLFMGLVIQCWLRNFLISKYFLFGFHFCLSLLRSRGVSEFLKAQGVCEHVQYVAITLLFSYSIYDYLWYYISR